MFWRKYEYYAIKDFEGVNQSVVKGEKLFKKYDTIYDSKGKIVCGAYSEVANKSTMKVRVR